MKLLDALATVAGRITAGVAMAVAILVGLWPDHAREIDPVRLGAVVTTVVAWLGAEVISARKPSQHDLGLFASIVELLPLDTVEFLRTQDFHSSFARTRQGGLFELAGWEGSRYRFLDRALQKRWAKLHGSIKSFSAELAAGTGPVGAGPLFSAHPDGGNRANPEAWVLDIIRKLNASASTLSSEVDTFETFARSRLGL